MNEHNNDLPLLNSWLNFPDDYLFTITEAAVIVNMHENTLRRWDKEVKLVAFKTFGNVRRYKKSQLAKFLGINNNLISNQLTKSIDKDKLTIVYGRVSSHDQRNDLITQVELLENYAIQNGWKCEVFQEIASGLNFKRKQFGKIVDLIQNNEVERIIVTYQDRLMRFGFEMFKAICNFHEVEIIILKNEDITQPKTYEEELCEDIIALITSFSGKLHERSQRSHKNKEKIKQVKELLCN